MASTLDVASIREQHGAVGKYLQSLGARTHPCLLRSWDIMGVYSGLLHAERGKNRLKLRCPQVGARGGWTYCRSGCGKASCMQPWLHAKQR